MAAFFTPAGRRFAWPGYLEAVARTRHVCAAPGSAMLRQTKKGALWLPWFCLAIKSELIAGGNAHVAWFTVDDRTVDIGIVGFIKQVVDIAL